MNEVPCRVLDVFFEDARRRDLAAAEFLRGTSVSLDHLRSRNAQIHWDQFSLILRNFGRHYTPGELEVLGGAFVRSPVIRPFALVARLLFTARDFYRWGYSPNSPVLSVFGACMTCDWTEQSENQGVVVLKLKNGLAPSTEFNHIALGAVVQLPRLVGEPPAEARMDTLRDGVRYTVVYSSRKAWLGWLRKALVWPFNTVRAGRALKEAHDDLSARFLELMAAKNVIALQATQLQTAYAISQAVHSDVDLKNTLERVANAFVGIAGFAGAHVVLSGAPLREAWSGAIDAAPNLTRPLEAGGAVIGRVALWFAASSDGTEREALVDTVVPTVAMALHGAHTHDALLDAQAHLERRVEQRTHELMLARDDLAQSYTDLEASEKARSRIFANVNHEIRTPLTLILMSVEELRRSERFRGDDDRALSAVARNARKLLRLVDGLLLLASGDENKLAISPSPVELGRLVTEVVDGFAASARSCGITLRMDVEPGLRAEVDEVGVERILSNLVSNAIKFTPPEGEVVVTARGAEDRVEVLVRDTGIGVSEAFLARAFGRFEQDGRPLRPGAAGSGIGLSIVRELARAHLGDAAVDRLPVGTQFRVWLPRVAQPGIQRSISEAPRVRRSTPSDFGIPSGQQIAPRQVDPRKEHTILVIEDDDELRSRIVDILAVHFRVLSASTGEAGLELATTHRPELLVSDVGLPGIDGLEVTRRFRALEGNRIAPVLLLTAYGTIEQRLSGFEAGAVDYMTKPFEPTELIARVDAHLERRRLALQLHESEKLAALGTMTAGLAHEMRNPANALVNAIEPLIELLPDEVRAPDTVVADLLGIIRDCGAQIALLSRQLLGFRRGTELEREDVDAVNLVERAIAILKPALKGAELRIDFAYTGGLSCAPALLLQVLGNLLDNAAHAAAKAPPPRWVAVSTFEHDGRFVCEVGDSGSGVPVELRDRIFEPFFTTKAPGEGTGLGLSTSRQIVDRHDGALYVRATDDGSVFRLELPLRPRNANRAIASG